MRRINVEEISKYIEYNSETGELTYINSGRVAKSLDKDGYNRVAILGKRWQAHRIAWALHYWEDPGEKQIDHINMDKLDNRIVNLRLATSSENKANMKCKGITRKGSKWGAQTKYMGRNIWIGTYTCPLIAHLAYKDKMHELHGEFASS